LDADVFVLLAGLPYGRTKYAELGAAISSSLLKGKPKIYIIGDDPDHSIVFFTHL